MSSIRLIVRNPSGLHARPAALFVRTAGQFGSTIRVSNATRGSDAVDAKSILGVMKLGVSSGHEIELSAEGDDADEALRAIQQAVDAGLGEALGDAPTGTIKDTTSGQPDAGG